jgi:hypothetical protein
LIAQASICHQIIQKNGSFDIIVKGRSGLKTNKINILENDMTFGQRVSWMEMARSVRLITEQSPPNLTVARLMMSPSPC